MKTIITTLPIYKALRDQCYERGKANGSKEFAPIFCPRHRLPSIQWMDDGDGAASVTSIHLISDSGSLNITTYFQALPTIYTSDAGVDYFIYNGGTLKQALPIGTYYLKIIMDTGHIYYSDWFTVQCVYCAWAQTFVNFDFSTLDIEGTLINSAIGSAGARFDSTPYQVVYKDQQLTIMFYLTDNGSIELPRLTIRDAVTSIALSIQHDAVIGFNEMTFDILSPSDNAVLRITAPSDTSFSTSDMLVYTQYACGYVTLSFSNCCNIGDLLYENDFVQTLWLKSDNIEQSFPYTEKGQENGNGKFIPTWRRQEKIYTIRTGIISQYMVDVLHRLKMHDVMMFIDQVGEAFVVNTVDTEHEWMFEDKYYATASVTLDLDEAVTMPACC